MVFACFNFMRTTMGSDMKLLSYADLEVMGLGVRSTIWRMIQMNEFPAPLRIGINKVAWPEQQILDWIASRGTEKCAQVRKVKQDKEARA